MAIRKQTVKQQIEKVRKAFPNRNTATGQIYNHGNEQRGKFKQITMHSIFVSDEGTFLVRPHVFNSKDARTAGDWSDYLSEKYGDILPRILDGMYNRTEKYWRLYRVIGWTKNDTSQLKHTASRVRRNKTTQKRKNSNA